MLTAPSSRYTRRAFSSVRIRVMVAFCALATMCSAVLIFESRAAVAGDPIQIARFSEENLPAEEMPSVVATPEAGPATDWEVVPASSPAAPAVTAPPGSAPAANSPLPVETNAAQLEPTPIPTPTDIAPLEVGSVAPQTQISDSSLEGLIQKISAAQPALAASLRLTDQARDEILNHHEDDAIQTLTRAISIDASNAYAYFYLGRAYLGKKNYDQAITFFNRAEVHFGANSEWRGETLAFEGLVNEQSGQTAPAIACYQKALVAVPGNLRARVGLTRLGGEQAAPAVQPVSAPGGAPDAPSAGGAIAPPPNSPPPPPADSSAPAPANSSAPQSGD
jgi:TolA-binding protein